MGSSPLGSFSHDRRVQGVAWRAVGRLAGLCGRSYRKTLPRDAGQGKGVRTGVVFFSVNPVNLFLRALSVQHLSQEALSYPLSHHSLHLISG